MENKILNVGCGDDVYGTDFLDLYPRRKEIIKYNIEKNELPFKKNYFDEVYSAFLIEHLKDIFSALIKMKRVLKPGGKLIIKTDNAGWYGFHNAKSKSLVHYGGYKSHGKKDIHYALFTLEHLKNYFLALNMKNISIKYIEGNEGKLMKYLNRLLFKTRFRYMAFPHILITGTK